MTHAKPSVAIIGAGAAGLSAAMRLRGAGFAPVIFDKGRGLGGRLATRRTPDGLSFDHGAQFMTARDADFRAMLDDATAAGTAAIWLPAGQRADAGPWIVGTPTMNAPFKPFADGCTVHLKHAVTGIAADGAGWMLSSEDAPPQRFDIAVTTVPVIQARVLCAAMPALIAGMQDAVMDPCWALLVAFAAPLGIAADVIEPAAGPLSFIARGTSKPGRPDGAETWTVHATPEWSAEFLEIDKPDARVRLLALLGDHLGMVLPVPIYAEAHRWRYARTRTPLGRPYLANDAGTIFVGGDWCLGARVEAAVQSGLAIADAIIASA